MFYTSLYPSVDVLLFSDDPSLLIMSTLQGTQAQLWTVLADIEVGYPSFAPKILHNETEGQIWATASDIRGKRTFFADIR